MRSLTVLGCLLVVHATLYAQQQDDGWPRPSSHPFHATVDIVTTYQPGIRHGCLAIAVDNDALTCEAKKGHSPVIYQREDIADIILPPRHSTAAFVFACFAAGGTIALLFVNPLLALPIGVLALAIEGVSAMNHEIFGDPNPAHHDIVLYQQPGVPLTVRLR